MTYFAYDQLGGVRLLILDWDIAQIEGAMLETWLPRVFERLEELARQCGARRGSLGAFIEDKNSGTILLQQALRRRLPAHPIEFQAHRAGQRRAGDLGVGLRASRLGQIHRPRLQQDRGLQAPRANHLLDQIESFRVGDKKSDREDDLLDTFCYGVALALGNREGF